MYSIETSKESGIAISSMARALESLQERDFIQKEDGVFYLTVPIYRQLLKKDDSAVL
jgi:DNA-binding IclR family transcriptional regulator